VEVDGWSAQPAIIDRERSPAPHDLLVCLQSHWLEKSYRADRRRPADPQEKVFARTADKYSPDRSQARPFSVGDSAVGPHVICRRTTKNGLSSRVAALITRSEPPSLSWCVNCTAWLQRLAPGGLQWEISAVNRVTSVHRKQTETEADAQLALVTPRSIDGPVRPAALSHADRLFTELDHRQIGDGLDSWMTLVTGVHIERHEAWIQIAVMGDPARSVVVHLPEHVTADHALAALAAWTRSDEEGASPIIEVLALV
jgi:hypothetical protein